MVTWSCGSGAKQTHRRFSTEPGQVAGTTAAASSPQQSLPMLPCAAQFPQPRSHACRETLGVRVRAGGRGSTMLIWQLVRHRSTHRPGSSGQAWNSAVKVSIRCRHSLILEVKLGKTPEDTSTKTRSWRKTMAVIHLELVILLAAASMLRAIDKVYPLAESVS